MFCRMKQCDDDSVGAYVSHYAVKPHPPPAAVPVTVRWTVTPKRGGQGRVAVVNFNGRSNNN